MKPGVALSGWLGDPDAQAATAARNRRFADRAHRTGRLSLFARELDLIAARRSGDDPGSELDDAVRRLLAETNWATALIADAMARAARDPFFDPPFASLGAGPRTGLVLLDHPLALVTASLLTPAAFAAARRRPGPRSIGFTGTRSLTRFVRAGGARLVFYVAAETGDGFCAATAPVCRREKRRTIADGEIVAVDGRTESFVIDAIGAPVLMVAAELRAGAGTLAREYDAATLAFVGASAAEVASSRIQLMLSLLRVLDRKEAAAVFAATVAQAPFFLRWHAMREFLALDAVAAMPMLLAMAAGDPHSEVRAAAQRTLAILRVRRPALLGDPRRAAAA